MPVVDLWVNVVSAELAARFTGQPENAGVGGLLGGDLGSATDADAVLATMDACGVDVGVLTAGLSTRRSPQGYGGLLTAEQFLDIAGSHPGRFLVAVTVDDATKPVEMVRRVRELAEHPMCALVRVTPLVDQIPINDRLYYPVYAACAELGLPVSVNVGVPGPRVRSRCQDPVLLEDVLIDFPGMVVIGAHMGHPFEALLMQFMMKWPALHLSNSAYLAKYMDKSLVSFMGSARGRGRVLFGSDHPFLPMERAIEAARALPLDETSMAAFLGGAALDLLRRPG